jgi:uncharacterized protein YndB with AHSA1/START domain
MAFQTSRSIAASPSRVFAAFADSARLSEWWGPAGFTSTFDAFEFRTGGKWSFVMHGPDGKDYPNEMVVAQVDPPQLIVLHHVSQPRYLLTVTLAPAAHGATLVHWHQAFEDAELASRMERIVVPANEQLLDRLAAEATGR